MEEISKIQRKSSRAWFYEFVHHLLLATVISSAMLILESTAVYRALDNFTHSFMGSSKLLEHWAEERPSSSARAGPSIPLSEYPQVLLLTQELQFHAIGARAKSLLAGVIQAILRQKPRLILLAIDVAPFPGDLDTNQDQLVDQTQLNRALDAAAGKGVGVVTLLPTVSSDSVGQARFDWLRDRCAAGVRFGLPVVRSLDLPVYDYTPDGSSVGVVASRFGRETKDKTELDVCAAARIGRDTQAFQGKINQRARRHDLGTGVPLNTLFFITNENIHFIRSTVPTLLHPQPTIEIGAPLPDNAVVVIGEQNDSIRTFGNAYVSPAILLAAQLFSEKYPVQHSLGRGFLVHLGLGVLLGYLFGLLWGRYAVVAARLDATPLAPWREKFRVLLVARGWLLVALVSLPVILWAIFALSGWMLRQDLWLNPFPLAIGMFVDALLHSRHKASHRSPVTFFEHLNEHPDMVWQVFFVAGVLIYFFAMQTH